MTATEQMALLPEDVTLEQTFADWGPSYDAMIAELESERVALLAAERDDEARVEPEFLAVGRQPSSEEGDDDGRH